MPVIFADNFETAIVWTKQTKTSGETITIVTLADGNKAAQFSTDGILVAPATGEMCYLQETLSQGYLELFSRIYVFYDDIPATSCIPLNIRNREISGGAVAWIQVGGAGRLYLKYNDATGEKTVDSGIDIVANRWYCMELHTVIGVGNGVIQLFVDGVKVAEALNIDNSTTIGPAQIIQVGERWFSGQVPHVVLIGDVVAATEYIGPIAPPTPNPKLTINASPELNVPVYIDNQLAGNTPLTVPLAPGTHTVRVEPEVQR